MTRPEVDTRSQSNEQQIVSTRISDVVTEVVRKESAYASSFHLSSGARTPAIRYGTLPHSHSAGRMNAYPGHADRVANAFVTFIAAQTGLLSLGGSTRRIRGEGDKEVFH